MHSVPRYHPMEMLTASKRKCIQKPHSKVPMNTQNSTTASHAVISQSIFTPRASTYDASNGGWHSVLASDYISWIRPQKGDKVLDLACGTGLVTCLAAEAIGPDGLIVGIDVTAAMLDEARRKQVKAESGRIEWVEHDISAGLDEVGVVRDIVRKGGFNLVICCSALFYLANPADAIRHWSRLLKPGGRMIVDVPTEDKTIQHWRFNDLRRAVGLGYPFNSEWVKGIKSLEGCFNAAGFEIEKSWRTRSYLPERSFGKGDADSVFEEYIAKDPLFADVGRLRKARETWQELWTKHLRKYGRVWDGHAMYVTVGTKRSV